jgi:hypothetical protein
MPKFIFTLAKYTIAPFLTHSPNKGAQPSILAATGEVKGGEYYGPTGFNEFIGKPGKATYTELSKDESIAKKLWEVSENLVGYKYL